MTLWKRLVFVLCCSILTVALAQEGCVIDMSQLATEPIVLYQDNYEFVYPPSDSGEEIRTIIISRGTTLVFLCPNGNITTSQGTQPSTIYATCNEEDHLIYNEENLEWTSVSCTNPRFETVRDTLTPCGENGRIFVIGFEVDLSFSFLPLITICFDTVNRNPLWTNHILSASIFVMEDAYGPYIYDSNIYNLDLNFAELYEMDYQRTVVNNLVGLPENSTQYIIDKPLLQINLAKYFMLRYQQNASNHHVNTVPNFYMLNGYSNWERLDVAMWQLAAKRQINLDIYTGTYGITTLPHATTGDDVEIFLYQDENNRAIPIPDLFWKVVFEPISRTAAAFVTINNPFQSNVTTKVLCNDITDQLDYVTWLWVNRDDLLYGYSYACTYEEMKEAIPYLPDLDVTGILI